MGNIETLEKRVAVLEAKVQELPDTRQTPREAIEASSELLKNCRFDATKDDIDISKVSNATAEGFIIGLESICGKQEESKNIVDISLDSNESHDAIKHCEKLFPADRETAKRIIRIFAESKLSVYGAVDILDFCKYAIQFSPVRLD